MRQPRVRERRLSDASKLTFSVGSVAAIVLWVLSLVSLWLGLQGKLSEIQTDVRIIVTRMDSDKSLAEKDASQRDLRVRELEAGQKAFDARIRQLETEMAARRGDKR